MNKAEFESWAGEGQDQKKPFEAILRYDPEGDSIIFITSPDEYYGERIDGLITVFISEITNEVIGSVIKGVSKILERAPLLHIGIKDGQLRMDHLIYSSSLATRDLKSLSPATRLYVRRLVQLASESRKAVEIPEGCFEEERGLTPCP